MKSMAFITSLIEPGDIKYIIPGTQFLPYRLLNWYFLTTKKTFYHKKKWQFPLNDGTCEGNTILVTLTGKQMVEHPQLGFQRTLLAARYAQNILNVNLIDLGSMTKFVTGHGEKLRKNGITIPMTHGDHLSAGIAFIGITTLLRKISYSDPVAVIGAYGTIGSALTILLTQAGIKVIGIGRKKDPLLKLQKLCANKLDISRQKEVIQKKGCRVIVTATSATYAVLDENDLLPNSIIYDIAQPPNVDKHLMKKRKDLTIVTGSLVRIPKSFSNLGNFWMRCKKGSIYACAAEGYLQTLEGDMKDHLERPLSIKHIKRVLRWAQKWGITHAPFAVFGKQIF